MQHLKTFEMFYSTPGEAVTLYKGNEKIVNHIQKFFNQKSSELEQIMDKLKEATIPKTAVKKIADFMMDTFGTLEPEMNSANVELLSKKLGLANLHVNESYKEGENLAVKILGTITQILGINQHLLFGIPLAAVISGLLKVSAHVGTRPVFLGGVIAGWAVFFLFKKIMDLFGYDSSDAPLADIGDYNPYIDIRNPNSRHRKSLKNKIDNFKTKIGFSK